MMRKKYVLIVSRLSEEKETVAKEEPTITVPKEIVSVPKPSKKKLYAGIIVALIVGLAIGYASSSIQITNLQNQLQNQQQQYESLLELMKRPRTTIEEGNVTWRFTTLDGTMEEWHMPIDAYVYYVNKPKPEEYHILTTDGQSFQVRNMELFVEPEFSPR